MPRILLTILLLLTLEIASAQIVIDGVISDSESGQKLEYAHVGIVGSNLGTVSNSVGAFRLILPERMQLDSVVVSYLGYNTTSILVKTFQDASPVSILLEPDAINLEGVTINANQKSIVEQAIDAIPENYDFDEMILDGFWRAEINDRNTTIQLSEFAFEIFRVGEPDERKDVALRILKSRISRDSAAFKRLMNMQAGIGPEGLFRASFLKGHPILSKKFLKRHTYDVVDIKTFNNGYVYVVEFDVDKRTKDSGYKGTMLIDTESLAFVKITYDFTDNRKSDPALFDGNKIVGWAMGLSQSAWTKRETELNYHLVNGKWYLSHAKFDAAWTLVHKSTELREPMTYYADFIITDINKSNVVMPEKDELARNKILENQFEPGEEDFWKDYNYLVPDKDFDRTFEIIQQRNLSN